MLLTFTPISGLIIMWPLSVSLKTWRQSTKKERMCKWAQCMSSPSKELYSDYLGQAATHHSTMHHHIRLMFQSHRRLDTKSRRVPLTRSPALATWKANTTVSWIVHPQFLQARKSCPGFRNSWYNLPIFPSVLIKPLRYVKRVDYVQSWILTNIKDGRWLSWHTRCNRKPPLYRVIHIMFR